MGGMHPELMGTSGQWRELYPGQSPFDTQSVPASAAHFAMDGIEDLLRAIVHIEAKGQVDLAACCLDDPFDNRGIFFYHRPSLELPGEKTMGLGGYGHDHQAGSLHIQAMHRRLGDHLRQAVAQSGGHAILFFRATARYGQETSWLIDDHYILVLVVD